MYKKLNAIIKIIILVNLLTFLISTLKSQNFEIEKFTTQKGLSQNTVNCILQDEKGFLWFGTEDGLNRFDGVKFTVFRNDPKNPNSISNSYILSIYEDSSGIIWIGTINGLNEFDRVKEKFIHYFHDKKEPYSLSNNFISSIYEDKEGNLWIGTQRGLNKFDKKEKKIHTLFS